VRKICLVFLVNKSFDCLTPFERAFKEIGYSVESIKLPNVWISGLTRKYVNDLKALIKGKKSEGYFIIFSPQTTELFLKEPDLTIIYSAYGSWFDANKMRVIPHLWTPVRAPENIDHLRWTSKPPARIGFMGRSFMLSRLVNIVMKAPLPLKQWLLRGSHLKYPGIISLINEFKEFTTFNAFPRLETMQVLSANREKYKNVELDLRQTKFSGSEQEINNYRKHIENCTYIVCPRGTENYSFRIYEALAHGRIPVIIDTDVVLPREINWDRVSIRVPYGSLESTYDIIMQDYNSRSGLEFIARQQEAFATMAELGTMRWVNDLANEVATVMSDV
jgi:hypothetical protein